MNVLKIVVVLMALISGRIYCYSQQYDTAYVHTFERTKSIKLFLSQRKTEIGFATSASRVVFSPGKLWHTGIGGTYKNMQLLIAIGLERERKFYSKNRDLKLQLNFGYIGGAVHFKQSVSNKLYTIDKKSKTKNISEYIPKIGSEYAGFKVFYIFNHPQYSIHAIYKQTQRQKISTTSILIMGEGGITRLYADTFLIARNMAQRFKSIAELYSVEIRNAYILAGYTCSLVWERMPQYYFAPVFMVGPGVLFGNYVTSSNGFRNKIFDIKSDVKLLMGYNSQKFYAGAIIEADANLKRKNKLHLQSRNIFWQFNFGIRF